MLTVLIAEERVGLKLWKEFERDEVSLTRLEKLTGFAIDELICC